MKWGSKAQIGLDIGNRTVKALLLKKKSKKVFLDKYFFYDLATNNQKFPLVSNLGETLAGLVDVAGLKNLGAAGCIDDSEVAKFDLTFPPLPKSEIAGAVLGEVEQRIHFPIDEASIEHKIVSGPKDGPIDSIYVKAYCTRLSGIKTQVQLFEKAHLQPECIDMAMLANISMLAFNGYIEDESHAVIIDLGETRTSIALISGSTLLLTNTIQTGFGTINRRLIESASISYHQAEEIKLRISQTQGDELNDASNIIEAVYLDLFRQMQKSMEYFKANTSGKIISKILIFGGGSRFPSIGATLNSIFEIETVLVNPFRNIEIFNKDTQNTEEIGLISPHMATVVGLALRGLNVGV